MKLSITDVGSRSLPGHRRTMSAAWPALLVASLVACGAPGAGTDSESAEVSAGNAAAGHKSKDAGATPGAGPVAPLHVERGTGGAPGHIVDALGHRVSLHGANRSGTEFSCLFGQFADGPADEPSLLAMKTHHINAVRVPLNEDCWLGINGVPAAFAGPSYQRAIQTWVSLITSNGMIAVVDLHFTAPGGTLANKQAPMADADHSPAVWSQLAKAFAGNGLVVFDLFNEPFVSDFGCWLRGGACAQLNGQTYTVAGMASLLKAVRSAGAQNVVMLGGLAFSSDLSGWVSSVKAIPTLPTPLDGISISNVAASLHVYDFNGQTGCPSQFNGFSTSKACDSAAGTAANTFATDVLAAGFPLVIGEIGISAFSSATAAKFSAAQVSELETWLDEMLSFADAQGQGYLGWSWNTDTPPLLITDFAGDPTPGFGTTYLGHIRKL